jgi:NAD+ diphosphatase
MEMQDLVTFNYCPNCGKQSLQPKGSKACLCTACNFQYYHNPVPAVAGIIEHEGKVLLIKRARPPQKGFWAFPGGFVDYEECLEDGLVREMREEVNLTVTACTYLVSEWETYLYRAVTYPTTAAYFVVKAEDITQARAGDDAGNLTWIRVDEINLHQLAFKSTRTALKQYKIWRNNGNFI